MEHYIWICTGAGIVRSYQQVFSSILLSICWGEVFLGLTWSVVSEEDSRAGDVFVQGHIVGGEGGGYGGGEEEDGTRFGEHVHYFLLRVSRLASWEAKIHWSVVPVFCHMHSQSARFGCVSSHTLNIIMDLLRYYDTCYFLLIYFSYLSFSSLKEEVYNKYLFSKDF